MKRGFTMIELIFVIVILGILAAVAIPKLQGTRDDAQATRAAAEMAQVVRDVGAYYTAKGRFDSIGEMTNVKNFNDLTKGAGNGDVVIYQTDKGGTNEADCVSFTFRNEGIVEFANSTGSTTVCDLARQRPGVASFLAGHNASFGGSSIEM